MEVQQNGYTFIELLGVILIIILVITPLLGFLNNILDNSLENHTFTQMNVIASSIIDRAKVDLKQDALDGEDLLNRSSHPNIITEVNKSRYNIPEEFDAILEITLANNDLGLYSIEVEVFSKILGSTRGVKLRTLVYEDE
jgi:type II secretory pathway pseudopilin PulG